LRDGFIVSELGSITFIIYLSQGDIEAGGAVDVVQLQRSERSVARREQIRQLHYRNKFLSPLKNNKQKPYSSRSF